MKILILGSAAKGALENIYQRNLNQLGVTCVLKDIQGPYLDAIHRTPFDRVINKLSPRLYYDRINQNLISELQGAFFDVILVFKGMTLYPDTLTAIKKHTALLCCYNPDHPFEFEFPGSGNALIEQAISCYDVYISYSVAIVESLKSHYHRESFVLPFGYDHAIIPDKESIGQGYHMLFIGAYDAVRAARLRRLRIPDLRICGETKWGSRSMPFSYIRKHYSGKEIYDQEYANAIAGASGVLNLLRSQNKQTQSHNMRTFEVPGYGGVLLSERTDEQEFFFTEEKEAVYFNTDDELLDKINFLNTHPRIVNKIKSNALTRSRRSGYDYGARCKQLVQHLSSYLQ